MQPVDFGGCQNESLTNITSGRKTQSTRYLGPRLSVRLGYKALPHRPPRLVWCVNLPHLPLRPQPGIKTRSSPAVFSTTLCLSFSSPLHSPRTTPVVPQASASSTFPCRPPPLTERYDAACERNASERPPTLIRSTSPQHSLVKRPTVGLA